MNEIIKQINVDFHNTRYIQVNAKQLDDLSRFILVSCYNQGDFYPIDNTYNYAYVRYRKADDLNVFNCCDITEDGKVLIELTKQMLAYDGRCYADLVIVHNEPIPVDDIKVNNGTLLTNENTSIVSTMLFCVNVIETSLDNEDIESSDEFGALNDLLIKATTDYEYVMAASKISEENAKVSEENAKISEANAKISENNAKISENNIKISEDNAKASADSAKISENNAATSEANAKKSAEKAQMSEEITYNYVNTAMLKAEESLQSATDSANSAVESANSALLSQSYAVGDTGVRAIEDTDNAKYYYTMAKAISTSLGGEFSPKGSITYSELQSSIKQAGFVYHIKDSFITDDTFKDGGGVSYPAGTNVYRTSDGYWDCFIGENINIVDDGDGNIEIICSYDFINTYDGFGELNQTVIELQKRIEELEGKNVLEIND